MKRGGKRRKSKAQPTQKQVVSVKVNVGDTVLLRKGNAPKNHTLQPFGQFRLMEGVGATYANPPVVLQQQAYGIPPSSTVPIHKDFIKVGGGIPYNQNTKDDTPQVVNPQGIEPIKAPSKRLVPSRNENKDAFLINEPIISNMPMKSDDPTQYITPDNTPSVRAIPSQPSDGFAMMNMPRQDVVEELLEQMISHEERQQAEEVLPSVGGMSSAAAGYVEPKPLAQSTLPYSPPGTTPSKIPRKREFQFPLMEEYKILYPNLTARTLYGKYQADTKTLRESGEYGPKESLDEVLRERIQEAIDRTRGAKAKGGVVQRSGVF